MSVRSLAYTAGVAAVVYVLMKKYGDRLPVVGH
jgi:hypothetical protein